MANNPTLPGQEPTLPGQERFVAPLEETPLQAIDELDTDSPPTSMWGDAWHSLRKNPFFVVSAILIVFIAVVVAFPSLFTNSDPTFCTLDNSLGKASPGHPFGFDQQGCDVLARTVYGARASVAVGVLTTLIVVVIGAVTGALAGFYGGWADTIISRVTDIFFAIPLVLAAIVVLQVIKNLNEGSEGFFSSVAPVVLALAAFAWPQVTRIMRGAVLTVKNFEYIDASTAIGATRRRNLIRHVVPNSLAPVIVVATVSLGIFIVAEATLSFLGLGLPSSVMSWGNDISQAQSLIRAGTNLGVLFYPAGALAITVLSFILLGDAVRDALDPKARKQ
ncbi:ABC transporter permease [Aeromicrobium sp.]